MENSSIGKKIAKLRKDNNMTQQQLALKLNVTDGAISKWETNKSNPDYDILKNICKVFNVKTSYFFDDLSLKEKIVIKLKELKSLLKKYWYILLFLIVFLFLLIYFISTINSFQMYELVIEDKNVTMESGFYTKTKNVISLEMNNINILLDDSNIISRKVKLYTFINNRKIYFYESEDFKYINIFDFSNYEEFISTNIVKKIPKGLYLEINDLNKNNKTTTKTIKVSFVKVYDSKWIINRYPNNKNENFEVIESKINIDGNILANLGFKQIDETNTYYKQLKKYKIYVDLNDDKIFYTKVNKNYNETFEYLYNEKILYYTKTNEKKQKDRCIVNFEYHKKFEKLKCVKGNCNNYKKIYDSFMNEIQGIFGEFSKS